MNYKQLILILLLCTLNLIGRHPFRLADPSLPQVIAQWPDGSGQTKTTNRYLRYYPLFHFKTSDFDAHILPNHTITFRSNSSETVSGKKLSSLIEHVKKEISTKRKKIKKGNLLEHFIVLQDKNFSYGKSCGLIVLAFKEYPFVVKLFMENPDTILDFHATGIEPTFFFYMGGGSNRHLSGFTRLANRDYIANKIQQFDRWANHVELPRKWFWLPEHHKNIVLTGKNVGGLDHVQTEIPSCYAIIADKMDFSNQLTLFSPEKKRKVIMQLCSDLELSIDPHAKNFSFTEDTTRKQFKITLVDTEHFPTMVGLPKKYRFRNHTEWYLFLVDKCFSDIYLKTKQDMIVAGKKSIETHHI